MLILFTKICCLICYILFVNYHKSKPFLLVQSFRIIEQIFNLLILITRPDQYKSFTCETVRTLACVIVHLIPARAAVRADDILTFVHVLFAFLTCKMSGKHCRKYQHKTFPHKLGNKNHHI